MERKTVAVWIGLSAINGLMWGALFTAMFKLLVGIIIGIIVAAVSFFACVFCGAASLADDELEKLHHHPQENQ